MGMKYVKLFENWLLTEAEGKQDAFDVNNPNGFPVANTTIGDFRKAVKSGKHTDFLMSIFRRACQTGEEWDPNAGKEVVEDAAYGTKPPKTNFGPQARVKEAMDALKLDYKDGDEMETLFGRLIAHLKEQKICDYSKSYTAKGFQDVVKDFSNYVKKLEKMSTYERQKLTLTAGRVSAKTDRSTLPIVKQILKDLEAKLAKVQEAKPKPYVAIAGVDEKFYLEFEVPDISDSSLNPDDGNIAAFICKDVNDYTIGGEEDTVPVDENQLTLGMAMTWVSNFAKTGTGKKSLLSKTGFNNYSKDIASIFGGEEAENLTSFAATIKIGGQNINFANSKGDGTETPMFGNNLMLGKCTFTFNSFEITASGKDSIANSKLMAALMKAQKSIEVVGHTDSSGKEAYNQTLSEKRANAVLEELKKNKDFTKIKATLTAVGKGETQPAKDDEGGKNNKNAALNRRVEFIIDGKPAFDYSKI